MAKAKAVKKKAAPKEPITKAKVAKKKAAPKEPTTNAKVAKNKAATKEPTTNAKAVKKAADLNEFIIHGMQEKKAQDITIVDLRSIKNAVADYFIICSGNSDTQVEAIAESIEDEVHKATSQNPWRTEGITNNEWVLLDYVDVVVHVFLKDRRKFYALEELWGDAKITNIENA